MSASGERFGEELYDDETIAAIEGWSPAAGSSGRPGIGGWRRSSASGAVLGAALLGLGDALEGRRPRERPPIVDDDPGEPHDPEALVELHFDPDSPAATTARLRRAVRGAGAPGGAVTPPP
ncbi:MAG: hypothetical protein M3482_05330 [Actinomycetota bacterium]|nr:hypothetical protein [Actinomycetota bacterium]